MLYDNSSINIKKLSPRSYALRWSISSVSLDRYAFPRTAWEREG